MLDKFVACCFCINKAGGWVVEKVDLYTTRVRLGTTREYSTFANGSLAGSRIVNLKRSEKPNIFIKMKFTTNVTKEMLEAFHMEMSNFIKDNSLFRSIVK